MASLPISELRLQTMRLLVCAEADARLAGEALLAAEDSAALVELWRSWKILAGVASRLAELDIALPPAIRADFGRLNSQAFIQSTLCLRAGVTALTTLAAAGIRCAGFKGIATLAALYPSARSRTLQDVDVLVAPPDAEAAMAVLEAAGFKRSLDMPWQDYLAFVRNSPGSAGNEAVSLTDAQGGAVDLHWRLGALEVEILLAGARPMPMLGRAVPVVRPGHSMLLSVHHALRNDFVPGDIARDVADFSRWNPLLAATGEWEAIRADADSWGLTRACLAIAKIVAALQGVAAQQLPLPASPAELRAAEQLCGLYMYQLAEGAFNTDLAYLATTGPALQILGGAAGGWRQYLASMRQSERINGEQSLPVTARVWNLAKSAATLSPGRWRQVRALAEAKRQMSAGPRTPGSR